MSAAAGLVGVPAPCDHSRFTARASGKTKRFASALFLMALPTSFEAEERFAGEDQLLSRYCRTLSPFALGV